MKRFIWLTLSIIILASFGLGQSAVAGLSIHSDTNESGVVKLASETDSSVLIYGNNIVIDQPVNGDVYCFGGNVTISAKVNGDILCFGSSTVKIEADVTGDVRLAGLQQVVISGQITGSADLAGNLVETTSESSIGRDFNVWSAQFVHQGKLARDLSAVSGTATIKGMIGRDASVTAESLHFEGDGVIMRNLDYRAPIEANINEQNVVGQHSYTRIESSQSGYNWEQEIYIALAIVMLAVGLVAILPRAMHESASLPLNKLPLAILLAVPFVVILPVISMIVLLSAFGFGFGLFMLVAWATMVVASLAVVSYLVGLLVLRKRATNAVMVALVGSIIVAVALKVPVVNGLLLLIFILAGSGMILMRLKDQFTKNPYKII